MPTINDLRDVIGGGGNRSSELGQLATVARPPVDKPAPYFAPSGFEPFPEQPPSEMYAQAGLEAAFENVINAPPPSTALSNDALESLNALLAQGIPEIPTGASDAARINFENEGERLERLGALQDSFEVPTGASDAAAARADLLAKSSPETIAALEAIGRKAAAQGAIPEGITARNNEVLKLPTDPTVIGGEYNKRQNLEEARNPSDLTEVGGFGEVVGDVLRLPLGLLKSLETGLGDVLGTGSAGNRRRAEADADFYNSGVGEEAQIDVPEFDTGNAAVDWMRDVNRPDISELRTQKRTILNLRQRQQDNLARQKQALASQNKIMNTYAKGAEVQMRAIGDTRQIDAGVAAAAFKAAKEDDTLLTEEQKLRLANFARITAAGGRVSDRRAQLGSAVDARSVAQQEAADGVFQATVAAGKRVAEADVAEDDALSQWRKDRLAASEKNPNLPGGPLSTSGKAEALIAARQLQLRLKAMQDPESGNLYGLDPEVLARVNRNTGETNLFKSQLETLETAKGLEDMKERAANLVAGRGDRTNEQVRVKAVAAEAPTTKLAATQASEKSQTNESKGYYGGYTKTQRKEGAAKIWNEHREKGNWGIPAQRDQLKMDLSAFGYELAPEYEGGVLENLPGQVDARNAFGGFVNFNALLGEEVPTGIKEMEMDVDPAPTAPTAPPPAESGYSQVMKNSGLDPSKKYSLPEIKDFIAKNPSLQPALKEYILDNRQYYTIKEK